MWAIVVALAIGFFYLLLSAFEGKPGETVEERLKRLVAQRKLMESFQSSALPGTPVDPDLSAEVKPLRPTLKEAMVSGVETLTRGLSVTGKLTKRLQHAGWKWRPAEFLFAQAISVGGGLLVSFLLFPSLWWLFAITGWLLPNILLGRAEKTRMAAFTEQLPDALAIVANALRSGYSFLQAMDVVSREMPEPISQEFGLVLREARINVPLEEALHHLVNRVNSPDLDLVVTAVVIQRQVGGNLSEILEKIGVTIKGRIRMKGEIRTLTTQGRFSGWIVSLLPFVLAFVMQLVAPGYLKPLFQHPLGWALLFIGGTMMSIGIFMIKRMVSLEV